MQPNVVKHFFSAICDDPCTLVQHIKLRDPSFSSLAFGDTNGCFERPNSEQSPTKDIDCPEIIPLHMQETPSELKAMEDEDPLVHPDVRGMKRYVMGTNLQMREHRGSHKRPECRFHDIRLSKQGSKIKTMNQESLQVVRKFKTIKQGNNFQDLVEV